MDLELNFFLFSYNDYVLPDIFKITLNQNFNNFTHPKIDIQRGILNKVPQNKPTIMFPSSFIINSPDYLLNS